MSVLSTSFISCHALSLHTLRRFTIEVLTANNSLINTSCHLLFLVYKDFKVCAKKLVPSHDSLKQNYLLGQKR